MAAAKWQPPHPDAWRQSGLWQPQRLDWWGYPLEVNAFKREPFRGTLRSLHVLPDHGLWVSGDEGLDRLDANGQRSDMVQARPPPTKLDTVFFLDNRSGWAVGVEGKIYATSDGGNSWQVQSAGTTHRLHDVFFVDARTGFAVGEAGTILATDDGGRTWQSRISGTQARLMAVHFSDAMIGWAAGDAGTILSTRDGGRSWRPQASLTKRWLHDVYFVDRLNGWAVGEQGTLLATRDGGATWQRQDSGTPSSILAVHFLDASVGWAAGDHGLILATRDGGASWQRQDTPIPTMLFDLRFADRQRGWAVGASGALLATHDGGQKWTLLQGGRRGLILDMHFADAGTGWAAMDDGQVLLSRDGGRSWQPKRDPNQAWKSILALHSFDARTAWALAEAENAGQRNILLKTLDGGQTWQRQSVDDATRPSIQLLTLHFADTLTGWAVGLEGTIYATVDGGRSWTRQRAPTQEDLSALHFIDRRTGWVVGKNGTIIATRDGGQTWSQQGSPVKKNLEAVHFVDAEHGWVVGDGGVILATQDGGRTWSAQTSETQEYLTTVRFRDRFRGWAAGIGGTLLQTRDGGRTWQRAEDRDIRRINLNNLATPASDSVVVAGDRATILLSRDGGLTWYQPHYARYPAPWTYVALLLGMWLWFGRLRAAGGHTNGSAQEGIADLFVSDDPVSNPREPDRLGHAALSGGLANFLRNRNTAPSLTLAVTGAWGSGKTSIMQRMRGQLEEAGFSTVWFNAWHHQQEGRQLASLLNAIRRQAVPPWYTLRGLRVRLVINRKRGWAHYAMVLFLIALGIVLVRDVALLTLPRQQGQIDLEKVRGALGYGPIVLTCQGLKRVESELDKAVRQEVLEILMRFAGLTANKLPIDCNSAKKARCQAPGAGIETDCRFRSLRQMYGTIQQALDDTPLTDREMEFIGKIVERERHADPDLESLLLALFGGLPILLGSVPQFVLLLALLLFLGSKTLHVYGVDYAQLIKHLWPEGPRDEGKEPVGSVERFRKEFELLTEALDGRLVLFLDDLDRCDCGTVRELLELMNYFTSVGKCFMVVGMATEHVLACIQPRGAPDGENDYARRFLQKVINIEVPVPMLDAGHARKWLHALAQHSLRHIVRVPASWMGGALVSLFLAVIWLRVEPWYVQQHEPLKVDVQSTQVPQSAGAVQPADKTTPGDRQDQEAKNTIESRISGQAAPERETQTMLYPILSVLLALSLALLWMRRAYWLPFVEGLALRYGIHADTFFARLRRSGGPLLTDDSDEFTQALDRWHAMLHLAGGTPRGVKRCINRIRLLAMLQNMREQTSFLDTLDERLRQTLGDVRITIFWRAIFGQSVPWPTDLDALADLAHRVAVKLLHAGEDLIQIFTEAQENARQGHIKDELMIALTTLHCAGLDLADVVGKLTCKPIVALPIRLPHLTLDVVFRTSPQDKLSLELRHMDGTTVASVETFDKSALERFRTLTASGLMHL